MEQYQPVAENFVGIKIFIFFNFSNQTLSYSSYNLLNICYQE